MNLSQVEAFCTIAEYGSVSEAARQLDCNRTKLSMAIKALEKDLDVELFTRTGNQLTLSEAGKAIFKDCENLLVTAQRIKKTCAQVSDASTPRSGWHVMTRCLTNCGKSFLIL